MRKKDILSDEEIEEMDNTSLDEILEKEKPRKPRLPRKGVKMVVSVRLDIETLTKLDEYAEGKGEKTTVVARELIREGLDAGGLKLSPKMLMEMALERWYMQETADTDNSIGSSGRVLYAVPDYIITEGNTVELEEGSTSYLVPHGG